MNLEDSEEEKEKKTEVSAMKDLVKGGSQLGGTSQQGRSSMMVEVLNDDPSQQGRSSTPRFLNDDMIRDLNKV